jgi:hypothetical protein
VPVVVLTPNLYGSDGISRLARLVTDSFEDVTVLALHEPASSAPCGLSRAHCVARPLLIDARV